MTGIYVPAVYFLMFADLAEPILQILPMTLLPLSLRQIFSHVLMILTDADPTSNSGDLLFWCAHFLPPPTCQHITNDCEKQSPSHLLGWQGVKKNQSAIPPP